LAFGLTGCRADGTGTLSLHPRPGLTQTSFDVDEFIAEHNRNAERIQSLEARPSIVVDAPWMRPVHVDGRLALERPQNFKLELRDHGVTKADLGSNAEEFWYWMANPKEPYIFWCRYDELRSSQLPVTYQPDWIIVALGLKPITPQEAATIKLRNGVEPGTTVLSFPAVRDRGEPYSRELVVANSNRRIKKLLIYSEAEKSRTLVAQAQPSHYQTYPAGSASGSNPQTCSLPQRLKLEWKRERLVMDVTLETEEFQVAVNQFDHAIGRTIFVEPERDGYSRVNLAEMSRGARPERRTTTRQTLPPPDSSRNEIELGRPSPMKDEEPAGPDLGRRSPRRTPDADETPFSTLDDLVGAPVSRPPNSGPSQAAQFSAIPDAASTIER
jgi:hypothetical protein